MCGMANWGNAAALTYAGAVKPCETLPCAAPGLRLRADGSARALAASALQGRGGVLAPRDLTGWARAVPTRSVTGAGRSAGSGRVAIARASGRGRKGARSQPGPDQAAYSAAAALA
jgi:hypothetical protein